ncbi:protein ZNF365 [Engystomops pustulosus]|uniref:protein ZNF365 n=1 Tax=Engystomops pustulosus TaxID=76066 RepID=UPI003AFA3150
MPSIPTAQPCTSVSHALTYVSAEKKRLILQHQQQVSLTGVMQQKTSEAVRSPWQESVKNGNFYKPFRCPQCGENARFRSLSSLRAHLDYMHTYDERYFWGKSGVFCSLKEADLENATELLNEKQMESINDAINQKSSSSTYCDLKNEGRRASGPIQILSDKPAHLVKNSVIPDNSTKNHYIIGYPLASSKFQLDPQEKSVLNQLTENVDKNIEKKIDNLNKELCQKTSELLEVRAAFLQLSQKKQEVQRRERALSRQVDVAVELIAILRQRLTESEQELQRKEEEVVSINHFLEAAAEKEFRGKRRLQHFIENLLQRVEVAEKQLEFYQNRQIKNNQPSPEDAMVVHFQANRKSKFQSRGGFHLVNHIHDVKPQTSQKGRTYINRVGIQPMKLLHESGDSPRDIWKPQKKSDQTASGRKVHNKTKIGKKTGMCNNVYKQY